MAGTWCVVGVFATFSAGANVAEPAVCQYVCQGVCKDPLPAWPLHGKLNSFHATAHAEQLVVRGGASLKRLD